MICDIVARGPVIGRYKDADICEWVEIENGRFQYEGVVTTPTVDPSKFGGDCLIVNPGILYLKKPN